jgi:PKD repeat protein
VRATHRIQVFRVACVALVCLRMATADIHYVNVSNAVPVAPYTNWATAATVIQDAIDVASSNDTVLVTNGVYAPISTTNTPLTIQSVNGTMLTFIDGGGERGCAMLGSARAHTNTVLAGFTLQNGQARRGGGVSGGTLHKCALRGNSATEWGGGASSSTLRTCTLSGNSADFEGGGAAHSTLHDCLLIDNTAVAGGGGALECVLHNCVLSGNSAFEGGGASWSSSLFSCALSENSAEIGGGAWVSTLHNCTLTGNSASSFGGGANSCSLVNSILWFNSAPNGPNWMGGTFSYCCTTPLPGGVGNISCDPLLGSITHLSVESPCIGRGNSGSATGVDIDGEEWASSPSMGCDEYWPGAVTGALRVAIHRQYAVLAAGFKSEFTAVIEGRTTGSRWDFMDGTVVSNRPYAQHGWSTSGTYTVELTAFNESFPEGVSSTSVVTVLAEPVHYVNPENVSPQAPFTSWATAATDIQSAVDSANVPGALVLVTNGVYDSGGRAVFGTMTNRIVIDRPIVVRSVNGPGGTAIRGQGPIGDGAVRCAHVGTNAVLSGFTLSAGHTHQTAGDWTSRKEDSGGAVWCETSGVISDCIIASNAAAYRGGGVRGGSLMNCTLSDNSAGGAGGGAAFCSLRNATLLGNSADGGGGGAFHSSLYNCTLSGNSTDGDGGGVLEGTLYNCTLSGNSAVQGGGCRYGRLHNCIVYCNEAMEGADLSFAYTCSYCCVPDGTLGTNYNAVGTNCITSAPRFVNRAAGSFRVYADSACIDAGQNKEWLFSATDIAGNPRIFNGTVDMGAHEYTMNTRADALLLGAHDSSSGRMKSLLSDTRQTPTDAPYAADLTTAIAGPTNTTDWLLLQLRRTNDMSAVASKSCFLRSDGTVVNTQGGEDIRLECSPGHYYLVAKHRNHLTAMSANPVAYTNSGVISYDFTTGPEKYWGGTNGCVHLGSNRWGLIAGDANGDGVVNWVDRTIVSNQLGMTGYLQGDLNLDGKVDGRD